MEMKEEMFEVLVGKYLDGEITPSEQRLLEAKLDRDPQAVELLEQFEDLNQRSSQVISAELLEKGKSPEEIFEKALQKSKHARPRVIRMTGWMRFAAGVAAGLIIGLGLHFILPLMTQGQTEPDPPDNRKFVKRIDKDILLALPKLPEKPTGEPIRNVDWFSFTDEQGNQWLVEGLQENFIRPASYKRGL